MIQLHSISRSCSLPEVVGPGLLYHTNGEAKNIYFLPRLWGSIEGKVHRRKGDSLRIHTTPMAKQKIKIFLPRHWGSIEVQVLIPIPTLWVSIPILILFDCV